MRERGSCGWNGRVGTRDVRRETWSFPRVPISPFPVSRQQGPVALDDADAELALKLKLGRQSVQEVFQNSHSTSQHPNFSTA